MRVRAVTAPHFTAEKTEGPGCIWPEDGSEPSALSLTPPSALFTREPVSCLPCKLCGSSQYTLLASAVPRGFSLASFPLVPFVDQSPCFSASGSWQKQWELAEAVGSEALIAPLSTRTFQSGHGLCVRSGQEGPARLGHPPGRPANPGCHSPASPSPPSLLPLPSKQLPVPGRPGLL